MRHHTSVWRQRIDAAAPDRSVLREAADVIASGGVVAFPTDTLYGLAADPFSDEAVARILAAKGRAPGRGLPLVAADRQQVAAGVGALSPLAARLADEFWPGPLTLLVPAPPSLAGEVSGGTGRVGVRVPDHAVARALCVACGGLLTATSANPSGEPAPADAETVARRLAGRIDLLLDAGPAPGGPPSTIVDVSGPAPRLVRAGAIAWERVESCAAGA